MAFQFDPSELAQTDDDAEERFERTRSRDPFPEIPPALLNTADLLDYIVATGMIHPFEVNVADPSQTLKPASCGIPILGEVRYWHEHQDEPARRVERVLGAGQHLRIERNSIAYVSLAPMFRLPDYLAARFNLTIRDVYRGILLGTGPLVDPGFNGTLSVPLHNLTFNEYTVVGGEVFVWMEFTKLSPHPEWDENARRSTTRRGAFVGFPSRKRNRRNVDDYLEWASSGEPIRSSIPALVGEAETSARRAASEAARIRNTSIVTAVATVVTILGLFFLVYQTFNDISADRSDLREEVRTLRQSLVDERERDVRQNLRIRRLEATSR